MAKLTKVLHGDLDEISQKIDDGICNLCDHTSKREEWTTEGEGFKCIMKLFEKHALSEGSPHATMAVTLLQTGDEIRLCAFSGGTSNAFFLNPYNGCEGQLNGALSLTLSILDDII